MSATNAELEMQGKGVIDRDDGYCGADECADGGADIDIDGDVGVCTGVDVGTGVGVGFGVCVNVDTGVGVGVGVGTGVRVNVDTGVGVGVSVGSGTGVNVDVSVAVGVNIGDGGGDSCCSGCDRDGKTLVLPLTSAPSFCNTRSAGFVGCSLINCARGRLDWLGCSLYQLYVLFVGLIG